MTRNSRLPLAVAATLLALTTAACGSGPTGTTTTGTNTTAPAAAPAATATAASASGGSGASADSAPAKRGITLRITGAGDPGVHVSYRINTVDTEDKAATAPWQKTVVPDGEVTSISLIAMSTETDELSCEIFIDGTSVRAAKAGPQTGGVAHCDWADGDL